MPPEFITGLFTLGGAAVGVIGTLVVTHIRREKRQLTAYIFKLSPVLVRQPETPSKVEISIDGKPVHSLYEQQIEIINTGNRAIPVEFLSIHFPGSRELLKSDLPQRRMPSEKFSLNYDEKYPIATITGDFLNPGEKIELRFLISGEPEACDVEYRQQDVKFVVRDKTIELENYEYFLDSLPHSMVGFVARGILRSLRLF